MNKSVLILASSLALAVLAFVQGGAPKGHQIDPATQARTEALQPILN